MALCPLTKGFLNTVSAIGTDINSDKIHLNESCVIQAKHIPFILRPPRRIIEIGAVQFESKDAEIALKEWILDSTTVRHLNLKYQLFHQDTRLLFYRSRISRKLEVLHLGKLPRLKSLVEVARAIPFCSSLVEFGIWGARLPSKFTRALKCDLEYLTLDLRKASKIQTAILVKSLEEGKIKARNLRLALRECMGLSLERLIIGLLEKGKHIGYFNVYGWALRRQGKRTRYLLKILTKADYLQHQRQE